MIFRLGDQTPPPAKRITDTVIERLEHQYEVDPELMRVLHAAVQAAQKSRRRQIDGAIVLAAVVGDGKSPAAGLLKAHGLTFEEAIRALQKANAKANAQARSRQFATPGPARPPQADQSQSEQVSPQETVEPARPAASLEPLNVRVPQETGQSVEEILAAARARIQQRTAAMTGRSTEPSQAPPVAETSESVQPSDGESADDPIEPTPAKPEKAGLRDQVEPASAPASAGPPAPQKIHRIRLNRRFSIASITFSTRRRKTISSRSSTCITTTNCIPIPISICRASWRSGDKLPNVIEIVRTP